MDKEIRSPLKAIRANCIECVGASNEVKLCSSKKCFLFPFRFGKNPYLKRNLSEEQKKVLRDRLNSNKNNQGRK